MEFAHVAERFVSVACAAIDPYLIVVNTYFFSLQRFVSSVHEHLANSCINCVFLLVIFW